MNRRNRQRAFAVLIAALAAAGAGCEPSQSKPAAPPTFGETENRISEKGKIMAREITIETSDGWTLYGDLYEPPVAAKGAVILLHQYGGTAQDWQPLCAALEADGITALALDSRGAGRSAKGPGGSGEDAPWNTENDIAAALDALPAGQPVALAGASYGANNALIFANAHPRRVRGIALFSPGANYHGLDALAPAKAYRGPILILTAAGDIIAASGPQQIHDLNPVNRTLTVLAGDGHGKALLSPRVIEQTVTFFDQILR